MICQSYASIAVQSTSYRREAACTSQSTGPSPREHDHVQLILFEDALQPCGDSLSRSSSIPEGVSISLIVVLQPIEQELLAWILRVE